MFKEVVFSALKLSSGRVCCL